MTDCMGPAHRAATSESGARSAGPLLSGNLETVFTDVPPRAWGGEGEGKGGDVVCTLSVSKKKNTKSDFLISFVREISDNFGSKKA